MPFDHEKLDVYAVALDLLVLANGVVERLPRGRSHIGDQLSRASLSIVLNIAEGAGKPTSAAEGGDCDDLRADAFPGAPESCNDLDDDCDGAGDGPSTPGWQVWWTDGDGDGVGADASEEGGCSLPKWGLLVHGDCDDLDPDVFPGAVERCNDIDDDCDLLVDEEGAVGWAVWHPDVDSDGFGDVATSVGTCDPDPDWLLDGSDCDDLDEHISPLADETCNEADDDCDLLVDDADPDVLDPTWYLDGDGDGWGDAAVHVDACEAPADHVVLAGDCDDLDAGRAPGLPEIAGDGIDQDCTGADLPLDEDLDGYVFPEDCDDGNAGIHPLATDVWGDGIDQNCDEVDGTDADGDGAPSRLLGGNDCDDFDPEIHPDAIEVMGDGIDNECDGEVDLVNAAQADAVIDPLLSAYFGLPASIADRNGDGLPELLVGAPGDGVLGAEVPGRAYVFFSPVTAEVDDDADLVLGSSILGGELGYIARGLSDLDGDGVGDFAISEPDVDGGTVYLFTHLPAADVEAAVDADASLVGLAFGDYLARVASPGDFSGDGVPDLITSASRAADRGQVYLMEGPFSGPDSVGSAATTLAGNDLDDFASRFAAGDVTGDGVMDLTVGDPEDGPGGKAYFLEGPVSGDALLNDVAIATLSSDEPTANFGTVVSGGDIDGDGLYDLAIGATGDGGSDEGMVTVWLRLGAGAWEPPDADAQWIGAGAGDSLGGGITIVPDADGDGDAEFVIGAIDAAFGIADEYGLTYLFRWEGGGVEGAPTTGILTDAVGLSENAVAADDFDGDGAVDLWIGSPTEFKGGLIGELFFLSDAFGAWLD